MLRPSQVYARARGQTGMHVGVMRCHRLRLSAQTSIFWMAGAFLSTRFMIPERTLPGPSSYPVS
jgi:hypothetical protein